MRDNEFHSDAERAREEEYFRRREQELIDRLRREAEGSEHGEGVASGPYATHPVKRRTPWTWRAVGITAVIAGIAGLFWMWTMA